jgi:acyl-CoA synthetase (AMP-forming)/AMP-acid ligase II
MDKHRPMRLLQDGLLESAKTYPDKVAIIVEGKPYTYRDLIDATLKLSGFMTSNGLERGDRCVIYMDNTWECIVSIYAVLMAGAVFVVLNPQTKKDKLHYVLNDCSAKFLVSDTHLYPVFKDIEHHVSSLRCIISSGKREVLNGTSVIHFQDAITAPSEKVLKVTPIASDISALIYTSGSTGNPKGVIHTHLSMTFALGSLIEYLRLSHEDRILVVLPLAFDYGLYQLLMSVRLGATLILERSFAFPAVIFKRMNELGVTVFPGVPTIYSMLMAAHERNPLQFPAVKRVTNTAAALPPEYLGALKQIFPSALIYKMYGLTECKRVCYLEPELVDIKPSSVGKAIPGTEVFILDQEGKKVLPGEVGILHVRGPHLMLGYWNLPDATNKVLVDGSLPREKILCTQDWFKMDEDGDLYFQGRSDDIIKTRGEKVSPIEVENVIYAIKGVREVAVIGVYDEMLGQAIKCFVSIDINSGLDVMKIKKVCAENLENFMLPKYLEIVEELPKTNTGKIDKKDLK